MKQGLYFQLFGNPRIVLNGEVVVFSFSKINALLYYLAVNKSASRDEVAGLLWPNMADRNAKKNLRNAIYQANKVLGHDYIETPNNRMLVLNEALGIRSDVDQFMAEPMTQLDLYTDEFLKGFYLKDSESFDLWVTRMRNVYEQQFVQSCYQKVESDIQSGQFDGVEQNIQRLISIDEFDERHYQLLMRYYHDNHLSAKVIEVYYQLSHLLDTELGVTPSQESKQLYERTLMMANAKQQKELLPNRHSFWGRHSEIEFLETRFNRRIASMKPRSVLLIGDAGIGKSTLCRRVLENCHEHAYLIELKCYQIEEEHCLRTWRRALEQLEQCFLQSNQALPERWHQVIEHFFPNWKNEKTATQQEGDVSQLLIEAMQMLSDTMPLIILIEDIQWLDDASLAVLTNLLLHLSPERVQFMLTLRPTKNLALERCISTVNLYEKIDTLSIPAFTLNEMRQWLDKYYTEIHIANEDVEALYHRTQGNPLYVSEFMQQYVYAHRFDDIPPKVELTLKNQMSGLTQGERDFLYTLSFFDVPVPFALIKQLVNQEPLEMMTGIEQLLVLNLVEEINEESNVYFQLRHPLLQEYLYSNQSHAQRRIIHGEIARLLEQDKQMSEQISDVYAQIAKHYQFAKQELKSVYYQLLHLQSKLDIQHELFPIYENLDQLYQNIETMDSLEVTSQFVELAERIKQLEGRYQQDTDYQWIVVNILYLEGRYQIRCGNYEQGISNLQQVIRKAKEFENMDFLLEAYRQMIYYFIQTDNAKGMIEYVDLAFHIAVQGNNHEAIGIMLRLKGLYHLMTGDLGRAEEMLHESIRFFSLTEATRTKFASNIAAANDYLAEIARIRGNYQEAIEWLNKAILLSEDHISQGSKGIFLVNMAMTLYAQHSYDLAEQYLEEAWCVYSKQTNQWRRPHLEAYRVLNAWRKCDWEMVETYFAQQRTFINSRDEGIHWYICAIIRHGLEQEDAISLPALSENARTYYERAVTKLSKYRDVVELTQLQEVFKPNI